MCYLEAANGGLSFDVFPKNNVKTFKETIHMLPEYCAEDHIGSTVCLARIVHLVHAILRLYKGRL